MNIVLNGAPTELEAATVADVVRAQGHDPSRPGVAVAVNGEVVPRSDWAERNLSDGDRVEVLGAVQGG